MECLPLAKSGVMECSSDSTTASKQTKEGTDDREAGTDLDKAENED